MESNWWKERAFYEVYMPSFMDGNDDGLGDFKGITSKLDYLESIGIKGLWITPFYPSPKKDNGYDIKDYYNIDPIYGTMDEFDNFIEEAHKRDIKVIVDMVLNHTSSEHPWFIESKSSKDNPKRDFYIWKRKDEINNWESFFGKSAWEFDETTGEYYYHAFAKEQVDLNWMNEDVRKAMYDVLRFWAKKNIDGFRLDVINFLKVNNSFIDNPSDKNEQQHVFDKDQEGILDAIKEIVLEIKKYGDLFVVGEIGSDDLDVLKNYSGRELLDVVFNFNLGSIEKFDLDKIFKNLKKMNEIYIGDNTATIFFNSHDMPRAMNRFSNSNIEKEKLAKLIATLICTCKAVPFLYYGEELGLENYIAKSIDDVNDIQGRIAYELALKENKEEGYALEIANSKSRDKSRAPMQWNKSENYGFTKSTPWLSFASLSTGVNAENQEDKKDSILNNYKNLLKIRNSEKCLQYGEYEKLELEDNILHFIRRIDDELIYVYLNFGEKEMNINIEDLRLLYSSENNLNEKLLKHEAKVLKKEI